MATTVSDVGTRLNVVVRHSTACHRTRRLLPLQLAVVFALSVSLSASGCKPDESSRLPKQEQATQTPQAADRRLLLEQLLAECAKSSPDLSGIERLLNAGADVDGVDKGVTPLMTAAGHSGSPELLALLLNAHASVDAKQPDGTTALMLAAQHNTKPAVVEVLVNSGARVNAQRKDGATALMLAANSNPEVVSALLAAGADVHARKSDGGTALLIAVGAFHAKCIEVSSRLIEAGADVNAKAENGWTPLMVAAFSGDRHPEVIPMLLRAGADPHARDVSGMTALDRAGGNAAFRGTKAYEDLKAASEGN